MLPGKGLGGAGAGWKKSTEGYGRIDKGLERVGKCTGWLGKTGKCR